MMTTRSNRIRRPRVIVVIAVLMIVFGIAEVATGLDHNFFGVTTTQGAASARIGVTLGLLYFAAGVLTLTMRRWAARVAIGCLTADVVGRLAMVATGLYPTSSVKQVFAIVAGTALAALFAFYIWHKRDSFQRP
jgi:hypothetical protein